MSSSRITMPRWPRACASGGKTGETKRVRLGGGTSRPATFTSGAAGGGGACAAVARARRTAAEATARTVAACLISGRTSCLFLHLARANGPGGGDDLLLQVDGHLVVV